MNRSRWFLGPILCLLLGAAVRAQEVTGTISGTVADVSGGVVAGASVTVTNTDKNAVIRTLATNDVGYYVATFLPIGHYTVTAEKAGFKKAAHAGIVLNVNDRLTVNLTLEVGPTAETVTVQASALHVELQTPVAAGLISGTQVRELPLNNRNYEQLVTLMPGVSSSASDQLYIGTTNPLGTNVVSFSINGSRNSANNWTIDGADNVDRGSNLTLLNYPSVDAIAEFKVLRGLYDAEFGRAGAGQINVVTKSGTSSFHGDAYEFFRNDVLSANNFILNARGIKRPPLRYNNFGYTIGGPVYIPNHYNTQKNKTFFFFSQEWHRVITFGAVTATVATSAEKAGTFPVPVCTAVSGNSCTASSTQITTIDPVAAAYIKDIWSKIPDPQDPVAHTLVTPLRNVFNHRQELVRIDHIFGPRLSIFGRYLHDAIPTIEPGGLFTGLALPGVATTNTDSPGRSWVFRATSSLTPNLLNEAGYSFSYGAIISSPVGLISPTNSPDVKVNLPFPSTLARVPAIGIAGGSGIFGFGPYRDFNRDHNIYDNLARIWGRHTTKVGFSYNHYQKTENAAGLNAGSFSFSGSIRPSSCGTPSNPPCPTIFQQAWANFLLGNASSFQQASADLTPDLQTNQFELFAQDEFRVRSNLTLTYGLRYSLFRQPHDNNQRLDNFDPFSFNPANAPQIDSSGNIVPATGDPLNGIIVARLGSKVGTENISNFAPRVGLAWDPFGDGKTSVRSGYGIFYDSSLFGIFEQNIFVNPPFVQNVVISNTLLSNPSAGTPSISAAPRALRGTDVRWHTPYVQEWSLDVQREVMRNFIVDIGYYGSKGTHLLGIVDINEVPAGLAIATGLVPPGTVFKSSNTPLLNHIRPFRGYNAINVIEPRFDSNYHSLQIGVQKRFHGDSLINVFYTFSKNLTDNQTDRVTAPQNTYNVPAEYGRAQIDRRNVLTANFVYELPWLRSQEGVLGHVAGGWEVAGIVSYASGLPLTVFSAKGTDPGGLGILGPSAASPRPDLTANPNSGAPHTFAQWFNTSVFADPPAGRPGNSGRGIINGPGYGRWDLSFYKSIRVHGENQRFQFRAEFFNMFNHTNPDFVFTSFGIPSLFGHVLTTRDPRIAQLALKFYW